MTKALDLIDRAYTLIGFKAAGEPLDADDADVALNALNSLLDSWNTQSMFIVSAVEVVAVVSGVSAAIGPGLAFNTPRPTAIENGAFSRLIGVDYPIKMLDRVTYEGIALKTVASTFPQYAYYNADMPTGAVFFYPVPSAPIEVHLPVQQQLTEFVDLATDYALAPGYRRALEYSLAEELEIGVRAPNPKLARMAALARRVIRRTNVSVPQLDSGATGARFNIYAGL